MEASLFLAPLEPIIPEITLYSLILEDGISVIRVIVPFSWLCEPNNPTNYTCVTLCDSINLLTAGYVTAF